jgi:hypothetical protein
LSSYTIEKFQEKLDRNISFRKKELTLFKTLINEATGRQLDALIRAGYVFLYAHWEGFIKESAREFLKFLNEQKIERSKLKDNYVIAALKYVILDCGKAKKSQKHVEIFNEIVYNGHLPFFVDLNKVDEPVINTESNLKSTVLDEILYILGLEKGPFELKYTLLDNKLLKNRNQIAHGVNISFIKDDSDEFEKVKNEYNELHKTIIDLMDLFKDKLLESASNKLYLKSQ